MNRSCSRADRAPTRRLNLKSRSTLIALMLAIAAPLGLSFGWSTLNERERQWIFQPGDRAWGDSAQAARGMRDVWIEFDSKATGQPARLHALWSESADPAAPVLLYLHGSRWNVSGSAPRIRRMRQLGFSVLAIDYRGFGKSTPGLPSEATVYEDARAAWDWLARQYPDRARYLFGHSLGGAVAIDLASRVDDESGTIVEGTFTSIADVARTFRWGWLPVGPLITQRFESIDKVGKLGAPLLVVHGDADRLIVPELGRRLYEAAAGPKAFVLVEGGSHYSTNYIGQRQYRAAIGELFGIAPRVPDHGASE